MIPFGNSKLSKMIPYLSIMPALMFYMIFYLGPSLATVVLSFTDITGVSGVPWKFIGFANYENFFRSGSATEIWECFGRTVVFSLSVVAIQNAFALFLAVLINRKMKGHLLFRAVIFMPVILGVTVVGYMWKLTLNPIDGPVQIILGFLGTRSNFLGSVNTAFPLVIVIQIWMAMGYSLVIFLAGLQTIPGELYEAGQIDGAGRNRTFRSITLPLLAPAVTVNVLLAVIGSLQVFDTMFVLTNGFFKTKTLSLLMFQEAFRGSQRQGYASSLAVLLFFLILFFVLIFQVYLRRREENL